MKTNIAIACITLLMYSCSDDECGEDINLGTLELAESTTSFLPYSGDEILVFEDNAGTRHSLTSKEGLQLSDTRLVVNTLCSGNFDKLNFDDQEEFYQTQNQQVVFYDESDNQIFYIDINTLFETNQSASVAIYDLLTVHPSVNGATFGNLNIITSERQHEISPSFKEVVLNDSRFIGDTLLYGKAFGEVYKSATYEGRFILYNRTEGVIAIIFNDDEYWVLAE
jgi:hypothetical protein